MALTNDQVRNFVDAISKVQNGDQNDTDTLLYATYNSNGTVTLQGASNQTPVSSAITAKEGDTVLVKIQNHQAVIIGNVTDKAASSEKVDNVETVANTAKANALLAQESAAAASISAEQAFTASQTASQNAAKAILDANTANTAAQQAQTDANAANAAAQQAQSDADTANSAAQQAQADADTAKTNAATAQSAANQAVQDASSAQAAANEAKSLIGDASALATEAKELAEQAIGDAATASSAANDATTAANEAKAQALSASNAANDATSSANEAKTQAQNAYSEAQDASQSAIGASISAALAQKALDTIGNFDWESEDPGRAYFYQDVDGVHIVSKNSEYRCDIDMTGMTIVKLPQQLAVAHFGAEETWMGRETNKTISLNQNGDAFFKGNIDASSGKIGSQTDYFKIDSAGLLSVHVEWSSTAINLITSGTESVLGNYLKTYSGANTAKIGGKSILLFIKQIDKYDNGLKIYLNTKYSSVQEFTNATGINVPFYSYQFAMNPDPGETIGEIFSGSIQVFTSGYSLELESDYESKTGFSVLYDKIASSDGWNSVEISNGKLQFTNDSIYSDAVVTTLGGNANGGIELDSETDEFHNNIRLGFDGLAGAPENYESGITNLYKHTIDEISSKESGVDGELFEFCVNKNGMIARRSDVEYSKWKTSLTNGEYLVSIGSIDAVESMHDRYLKYDGSALSFILVKDNGDSGYDYSEKIVSVEGHFHDDRYYTESEIDNKLNGYSLTDHIHDDRYYTESEIDTKLNGYSPAGHTHDDRYYTESEIDNKLDKLFKVVEKTSVVGANIAAGATQTITVAVNDETGYTPLGILGYQLLGTSGQTYLNAYRLHINGNNAECRVRNVGTTAVSGPYASFRILYVKTNI